MSSAAIAHARVRRCVDEQGKVSFSGTVCNRTRAQEVFGANASAKPWQAGDYRPLPVVQGSPAPPRRRATAPPGQHSTTLTASPPNEVSL